MKPPIRFTIRALLILILLASFPCWWVARQVSEYRSEQIALTHIQQINPKAGVKYENKTPNWMIELGVQPQWMDRATRIDATGITTRSMPFEEFPKGQIDFDDDDLWKIKSDINSLKHLREIYFSVTKLTDSSIKFFIDLDHLQILNLQETNVTVTGADKLRSNMKNTDIQHFPASSR